MGREEFIKKFKVGSKARLRNWKDSLFVKITAIGENSFLAKTVSGSYEGAYEFDVNEWLLYEEPKPENACVESVSPPQPIQWIARVVLKNKKWVGEDIEADLYFVVEKQK